MNNKTIQTNTAWRVKGVSLIELLISMGLGLILLTGMIAVFSGNKRSAELNTAMANIQENARFALNQIGEDIRMASFQGCLDPRQGELNVKGVSAPIPIIGVLPEGGPHYSFNRSSVAGSVVVQPAQWQPAIAGGFVPPVTNPAIAGTHAIVLQYASTLQSELDGPVANGFGGTPNRAGTVYLKTNLGLATGDLAVISNCDNADLFAVSTSGLHAANGQFLEHKAPLNWDGNFTTFYGRDRDIAMTRVSRFVSHIYYVGDTGLSNEAGDTVRALYQQSFPYNDDENPPVELVQGVENMRVSYGIKDQNTLRYVTANDPAFRPQDVESVQIGLIMASYDRISEQNDGNTYVVAGQSIEPLKGSDHGFNHAGDQRYRLVFNTTVKVRNRREESIFMSQANNQNN